MGYRSFHAQRDLTRDSPSGTVPLPTTVLLLHSPAKLKAPPARDLPTGYAPRLPASFETHLHAQQSCIALLACGHYVLVLSASISGDEQRYNNKLLLSSTSDRVSRRWTPTRISSTSSAFYRIRPRRWACDRTNVRSTECLPYVCQLEQGSVEMP